MSVARRMTRRRRRKTSAVDYDVFEKEFAIESLKSERLRVSILIGAIVSALVFVLIMAPIFYAEFQSAFHGKFREFLITVYLIFGANVLYLTSERIALGRLIKKQQKPFPALKYVSAFVETRSEEHTSGLPVTLIS